MSVILQQVASIDEVPVYAYTYPSGSQVWVINPADIDGEEKKAAFMKWMDRQTRPVITGTDVYFVYSQDYAQFNSSWHKGDKNPHVWD